VNSEARAVSSVGCRITCVTPSEANLRKYNKYTHSMIKLVLTCLKKPLLGPVPDVANDRSRFTSRESDCASNVTWDAGKQCVDRHRIICAD
jgi:hypothetical protein